MIKNLIWLGLKSSYPVLNKIMSFSVFTYLTVGAFNTFLNIVLFIVFYNSLNKQNSLVPTFALEIATLISFIITVFTGFWLNKNFAFSYSNNNKKQTQKQFGKYCLVAFQGQLSDYFITKILVVYLLINGSIAYLISTVILLLINYFLQKYFTFKL